MLLHFDDHHTVDLLDTLIFVTVDPGGGASEKTATKRTDRCGFTVNAVPTDGKWLILDCYSKHLDSEQFVDELFNIQTKWCPYVIGIEKMPHLDAVIRLKCLQRNRSLPLAKLEHKGRKKAQRIMALAPLLPNIYFNETIRPDLQHRMQRWFTEQEHGDDDIDSLAYQIDIVFAPTKAMLDAQRGYRQAMEEKAILATLPPSQRPEWEKWLKFDKEGKSSGTLAEAMREMYDY